MTGDNNADEDVNYCFEVEDLESDRVRLTPFIPSRHGAEFYAASAIYPEVWTWVPMGPFQVIDDFLTWYNVNIHQHRDRILFAILDKSSGTEKIAGIIGFKDSSTDNLCAEIAWVITLPPFQRTHVTTHGIGLLLHWGFDRLMLRRIQWQANEMNERSWKAAEKMGFVNEGVKRWERALPPTKGGLRPREGDPRREWGGRHTVVLAICWDEWEDGGKARVEQRMKI